MNPQLVSEGGILGKLLLTHSVRSELSKIIRASSTFLKDHVRQIIVILIIVRSWDHNLGGTLFSKVLPLITLLLTLDCNMISLFQSGYFIELIHFPSQFNLILSQFTSFHILNFRGW